MDWDEKLTLPEMLAASVEASPEKVCLYLEGAELTYADLERGSNAYANRYLELGIGKGDAVACLMETAPEHAYSLFACMKLGAVHVPINTAYRGEFLRHQLATSGASLVLVDDALTEQLAPLADQLPDLKHVATRADGFSATDIPGKSRLSTDDLITGEMSGVTPLEAPTPDDIGIVIWTGGTTGPSKGVSGSQQYMGTMARIQLYMTGFGRDDVFFQPTPLFHTTGLISGLVTPVLVGGAGALVPRFSASTYWDSARKVGATVSCLFGALYVMLFNQPEREDDADNSIRVAVGPVPVELHRAFEERFGLTIIQSYALSECVAPLTSTLDDPAPPGTSGKESPTCEIRLMDDDGFPVPDGEVGELWIRPRGPGRMFSGYFNNPQATVEATTDLWLHTGDLLRKVEGDWYEFVDRKQDYLRRRGINISSFEVEQAIIKHSAVADVAVHGVPSELSEQEVKACLVLQPDAELDMIEFMDFCVAEMPYYAVPRYVEVMDALPRNAVGRVLKFELRDRGVAGAWDREEHGYVVSRPNRSANA